MYFYKFGLFEDISDNINKERFNKDYNEYYHRYISEDKNISAMEYGSDKGLVAEEHFHDWLEITLVVKGEQHVFIKDQEYILGDGDILVIPYNEMHHSYISKPTYKMTMQFKMGYIERLIPEFDINQIHCASMDAIDGYQRTSYSFLVQLYCYMFRAFSKNAPQVKADFLGFFYIFFDYMMKECAVESYQQYRISQDNYVNSILSYLNKHYDEDLSLQTLSDEFHLSPQYISKIIKEETGQNFKNYLIRLKLEQAHFLMRYTNKTLLTISEECGFSNNKSFIYYFENVYGMSPSKYRKLMK